MQILSSLLVVIFPFGRKSLVNFDRKHARKNGIPGILSCSWKNAIESVFFEDPETFGKNGLYRFPLVKAKIVDQHKK